MYVYPESLKQGSFFTVMKPSSEDEIVYLVLNKKTFFLRKPYIAVKIANQYKEIDLTVDRLQKISDLFETEDIDFNPYFDETSEGCDSCGYGSAYFSEIKIFNSKVKI